MNAVPPADVPFGHDANGRDEAGRTNRADVPFGHDANGHDEAAVPYGHNLPGRDEVQLPVTTGRGTRPPHYLVSMDLVDVPCLVVGGGPVAARKIEGLVEAGAVITVVAPTVVAEIRDHPRVRWHEREYRRGEVASYRLAITATGVPAVDGQVAHDARAAGVPVNSADDPANCTFTLPAIARNGDIQVAVATAGRSPALASWLRSRIEAALDDSLLDLLDLLASTRGEMRDAGLPTELPGWRRALEGDLPALVADGRLDEARALLRRELDLHRSSDPALEGVGR